MAIAQDAETNKPQDQSKKDCMIRKCKLIKSASIYLDSPAVLIGQAEKLQLSNEQLESLKKIQDQARKKAIQILTSDQKTKLDKIPAKPITLAKLCAKLPCGQSKGTCPKSDAKSGCDIKSKACPVDCTKPCCAAKSKKCSKGSTKSSCDIKNKPTVEQTTCPIMDGRAISKKISTLYKGKTVFFCCPGCIAKFESAPEKYVTKLPQFSK